jgi:hypothetical protein
MERTSCVMSLIKDVSNQHAMYKDDNLGWAIASIKHNADLNQSNNFHVITNYENLYKQFHEQKNVFFHNYLDYIDSNMIEFEEEYVHLSTNPHMFEKNCILRYMSINDFCKKNNIHKMLHLEADVVLYSEDIDEDFAHFSSRGYALTLLKQLGAGGSFFDLSNKNLLQVFSDYVVSTFSSDSAKLPKCFNMEEQKMYHQESLDRNLIRGGVSDMHFWNYIYNTYKGLVFGNMEVPDNNIIWHCTLQNPDNSILIENDIVFINKHKILKISIDNNICHGFYRDNFEKVQIKMLHFHGEWKNKISEYCAPQYVS